MLLVQALEGTAGKSTHAVTSSKCQPSSAASSGKEAQRLRCTKCRQCEAVPGTLHIPNPASHNASCPPLR